MFTISSHCSSSHRAQTGWGGSQTVKYFQSELLHPYNFLQLNIVACTEAEAPQEEDEMSNPGLLLVSVVSQAGQYWTFQAVLASWKLFKSHVTMLA